MTSTAPMRTERHGRVLRLVLCSPQTMNAMSPALSMAIAATVRSAQADPAVCALLLTGEERTFSAGGNLQGLLDSLDPPEGLASDRAKLAYAYPHVGLAGDFAVNWSLNRILGPAKARYVCLLAEVVDAQTALAWGLVQEVHPAAQLDARAMALAARLAAMSPLALRQIKQNLDAAAQQPREAALQQELDNFLAARAHPEHREALQARLEHRAPRFDRPP